MARDAAARRRPRGTLRRALAALALGAAALPACGGAAPARPNLLFVVVDTLRKDALRLYGHSAPVSPHLDALAARGWTFEEHVSHASQTVPATLTMLLSQLPAEHGFRFRHPRSFVDERPVYPDALLFLAEVLRDAGYATAGFSGNPYLTRKNRFDQGFDAFHASDRRGERLTARAQRFLGDWARADEERPFFVYVHYMDVHQPYDPPEPWRSRFVAAPEATPFVGNRRAPEATEADRRYSLDLYAACTAYVDDQIGRLLATVEALGATEDTVVVVTSDHGEEFLEHGGVGHGRTVYGEVVRVPLVLVAPGRLAPATRVTHLSRHLDLAPTLLALLDVPAPPSFRGRSLLEPARRARLDTATWQGVYLGEWNLVKSAVLAREQLFARSDELDREPVDPERVDALPALRAALDDYAGMLREAPPAPAAPVEPAPAWSDEERARLRALGYAE